MKKEQPNAGLKVVSRNTFASNRQATMRTTSKSKTHAENKKEVKQDTPVKKERIMKYLLTKTMSIKSVYILN